MLQVENQTPFTPGLFVLPDADGVDTAYVVMKATFEVESGLVRVAKEQAKLVQADEYWGKPGESSVKYPSEVHLSKPTTDIVLVGSAHSPEPGATAFDVSLSVGSIKKVLRIFGDRVWRRGMLGLSPSAPAAVDKMVPLVYERAFGGVHLQPDGTALSEPRNPLGRGFRGKRKSSELEGQPLPNIEDPEQLLKSPGDQPAPAGFGCIAPSWQPRLGYAGTYDEAWQKTRAPYLAKDFDSRFLQVAHPGLICPSYLRGGEPVEMVNVSAVRVQRFVLPTVELDVQVCVAGEEEPVQMNLETLLLEPDQGRICIVWRGARMCDKKTLQIESVRFEVKSLKGIAD